MNGFGFSALLLNRLGGRHLERDLARHRAWRRRFTWMVLAQLALFLGLTVAEW